MTTTTERVDHLERVRSLRDELELLADEIEAAADIPDRAMELLRDNGLLRLTLPTEWGGYGLTLAEYFPVLQEVAKVHGTLRMIVHGQNGLWRLVEHWGTEEQKQTWLPRFRDGAITTFGLTEPGNGTGRDISTKAVRDGHDWVINGTKHLITWAGTAEVIHLIAITGADDIGPTASCFLLPKDSAGMLVEPLAPTMGCKGGRHDRIILDNVRLPSSALLGPVGAGLEIGLRGFLDVSRLSIAVSGLGLARRAVELAAEFAEGRVTFGKPIAARQAIQMSLAEMAADVYSVQAAISDATAKYDRGEVITVESSMCKLLALEMVGRVTDRAIRIFGGIGYTEEHKIERHYRDARALWFEEGTAEVQKTVIAAHVRRHGLTF